MSGFAERLRLLYETFKRVILRKRSSAVPPPVQSEPPEPKPEPPKSEPKPEPEPLSAPPEPEAEPKPTTAQSPPVRRPTAKQRISRYERARLKLDRFVEPKGPTPKKLTRTTTPRKPKPVIANEPDVPSAELKIVEDGLLFKESEMYGDYNFRDTILDQLDRYWVYLARMKKNDPDSYAMYSKLGAVIVPQVKFGFHRSAKVEDDVKHKVQKAELSAWWKVNRPSFGCVAYGIDKVTEAEELNPPKPYFSTTGYDDFGRSVKKGKPLHVWFPKFLYFFKYNNPPPDVERVSVGDVYKMTIWWDRPHDEKKKMKAGIPEEIPVVVQPDGNVQILKMLKTSLLHVPGKRSRINGKRGRKSEGWSLKSRSWGIPHHYARWAKNHGDTAENYLANLFCNAATYYEHTNYSMVRVSVKHRDMTAIFGVDIKRMGYFFQDRDITLTKNGFKQKVFHIVRAHKRQTKNGETYIPFHFRGLREFEWAGYQVSITIPGRDHTMLPDFDVAGSDEYWIDKNDKVVSQGQIADAFASHIAGVPIRDAFNNVTKD